MELISKIIIDALNILKDFWNNWGKRIIDGIKQNLERIKELWKNLWEGFLKPFIDNMLKNLTWLWDKHLKGLVEEIVKFVGKLVTAAQDISNKFIMPIVNYLVKTLGPTFSDIFSFIGDVIGTVIGVIADILKGLIKALGGVIDFIAGVFTGDWKRAWNGIKDFMSGIGDAIVGIFKGAVNLVIDAVNFLIRSLNKVKINVPKVNIPGIGDIGGGSVGFTIPEIPKLAKGGLAYGPTLAMVGDNRGAAADPEVIAPLSKLEAIIGGDNNREVLSELRAIRRAIETTSGNNGGSFNLSELARAITSEQNSQARRAGRTLSLT